MHSSLPPPIQNCYVLQFLMEELELPGGPSTPQASGRFAPTEIPSLG